LKKQNFQLKIPLEWRYSRATKFSTIHQCI